MIKIVLADDHQIVRQGIRLLLDAEPGFHITGEVADGLETLTMVAQQQPDVLIVDLMMPGLNGLDVIARVGKVSARTRIVVLSMHAEESYVLQALKNGADGYVLKDSSADHLVEAVREVIGGGRYLSPPLSERAIDDYIQQASDTVMDSYETLTSREREVMHLAAEGYNNPQIAERLTISPRTVENHRASVMRKLNLKTQTDLIRYAIRRGIISLED